MGTWSTTALNVMKSALVDPVERDHRQSDAAFRKRRIVVLITLVLGATVLYFSLKVEPGDPVFYALTLLLAAVWTVGGMLSGPLHLGRIVVGGSIRRPIVSPILIGLAVGGVFMLGGLVVRQIPPLAEFTENVLAHARVGSLVLIVFIALLNGVAEEIFFRGALYAAIGVKHPVIISTVVYAIATLASGNPMLGFAAVLLGYVMGLQRRASGGILAPILTHVSWSAVMVLALPPLFV